MPDTAGLSDLESLDQQIDLINLLKDIDEELAQFRDSLSTPRTGDSTADFTIDRLKDLLENLSGTLGELAGPLNEAIGKASEYTSAVQSVTGMIEAVETAHTATGQQQAEALASLWGHWTSALPLLVAVNPVIGAYFMLIGTAIESAAVVIGQLEEYVAARNASMNYLEGPTVPEAEEQGTEIRARLRLEEELAGLYRRRNAIAARNRATELAAARQLCARGVDSSVAYYDDLQQRIDDLAAWVGTQLSKGSEGQPVDEGALRSQMRELHQMQNRLNQHWRCVHATLRRYGRAARFRVAMAVGVVIVIGATGLAGYLLSRGGAEPATGTIGIAGTAIEAPATSTTTTAATTTTTIPEPTTVATTEPPPPPAFSFLWQDYTPVTHDWNQVSVMSDAEIRELSGPIAVPGFCDDPLGGPGAHVFPFPLQQFAIEPSDDPGDEASEYCANSHYVGDPGLTITGEWITQPGGVCAWGSPEAGDGTIVISGSQLADWMGQLGG